MAKQESSQSVVTAEVTLVDTHPEESSKNEENQINEQHVLEFISRHHLKPLWDEVVEEKAHPKIPLSAQEVLEMINLSPEEQDKIIKSHA